MPEITFTPSAGSAGTRIDVLLGERFPEYSRSRLKKLFDEQRVFLGDRLVRPGEKYREGSIRVLPSEEGADGENVSDVSPVSGTKGPRARAMDLDIVYEDDALLVVNKPQGLVVHPAPGHHDDTLVNALIHRYGQEGLSDALGALRPGIVHRIDKDTSGLLLIVKDSRAHAILAEDLKEHKIRRSYLGLVHGFFEENEAYVDAPIARHEKDRKRMAVRAGGREARTHFRVLQRLRGMTLLDLELESGRTHQIRVHMQYIRHPIVGDPLYAGRRERYGLKGQALHAYALEFRHPFSGQMLRLNAPLPAYFQELILQQGGDLAGLKERGLC